jgi:hypothetical protein
MVSFWLQINYHSRFKLCHCHICYFSGTEPTSHGALSVQVMDISLFMRCKSDFKVSLPVLQKLTMTYRSRDVATPSGPVDVDVLALLVLLAGVFWLDPEGVCAEVITLRLEQVGGQVLSTVSVVEAERGAESGCGDTPESTLGDDAGEELV